jgi:hypothetical protein
MCALARQQVINLRSELAKLEARDGLQIRRTSHRRLQPDKREIKSEI